MEELTRFRTERGWSQQRLANESGVNKATINQIEKGRRSPNLDTLEKLASVLGIGVADFFPKAQPPLWSDEPRERRPFNFREARESLEEFCKQWEQLIVEGELDEPTAWRFFDSGCWIPMMDIALATELHELHRTTGLEGQELLARSEIAKVNDRYLKLFDKVLNAFKEMRPEIFQPPEVFQETLEDTKTNVVRFEAARDRLANRPDQMFG